MDNITYGLMWYCLTPVIIFIGSGIVCKRPMKNNKKYNVSYE